MANNKPSKLIKLLYGSESENTTSAGTYRAIADANKAIYDMHRENKKFNKEFFKLVEDAEQFRRENNIEGEYSKYEKLPEGNWLAEIFMPHMYKALSHTVRMLLLLVFYAAGLAFLIWLIQLL